MDLLVVDGYTQQPLLALRSNKPLLSSQGLAKHNNYSKHAHYRWSFEVCLAFDAFGYLADLVSVYVGILTRLI